MGNWKDLGVVPDSDDDDVGFDSDNSSQLSSPPDDLDTWGFSGPSEPPQYANVASHHTPKANHQAANFLATSASSGPSQSQSLGEQQTSPSCPDVRDDRLSRLRLSESPDPLGYTPTQFKPALGTSSNKDAISPSAVHTKTRRSSFPSNPLGNVEPDTPTPGETEQQNRAQIPVEPKRTVPQQVLPVSTFPEQNHGRRSLRPRKPIQEHPYLLENAQYSRVMMTHGVKPIRVTAAQESQTAKEPGEDSQDHDYTGSDSQPTSGLPEETQIDEIKPSNIIREADLHELALSLSPKTSSPQRHLRESSEQGPGQHTDNSSISDEDEFPDIKDLLTLKGSASTKPSKRQLPAQSSTSRKRIRTKRTPVLQDSTSRVPADAWDFPLPPSDSQSGTPERNSCATRPPSRQVISSGTSPCMSSSQRDILLRRSRISAAPLIEVSSGDSASEKERASDPNDSASESDFDLMQQTRKKIKGVLPASWLRLDQQTRKMTARKTAARSSPPQDLDEPRPGLAIRRLGPSKSTSSVRTFLDELNDGSDENDVHATPSNHETLHHDSEWAASRDDVYMPECDDGGSVVEEDVVDMMLPNNKRRPSHKFSRPRKRQKTKQVVFKEPRHKRYQQHKIDQSFHPSDGSSSEMTRTRRPVIDKRNRRQAERLNLPPALSIVDFIQPNAPDFIKIAARSAGKRKDMGRSKPSHKNIDLGNRTDNVDALSVLTEWRSGKLKPSPSAPLIPKQTLSRANLQTDRQPLRPLSTNFRGKSGTPARISFTQPQKLTRQINVDEIIACQGPALQFPSQPSQATKSSKSKFYSGNDSGHRPAQLENETFNDDTVAFTTRKKILDLVFRKDRREVPASTFKFQQPAAVSKHASTNQSENRPRALHDQHLDDTRTKREADLQNLRLVRRRLRKATAPRRLDLEAPQFKHANDPIPITTQMDVDEARIYVQAPERNKILGLGPFGTQYTHHFDIFPLHEDTYFHNSTLIGDGTLKKVLDFRSNDVLKEARPAAIFDIFDHHFHWDIWTDTTSSELGLLFDLMTEQLEVVQVLEDSANQYWPTICANHILKYLLQSVRLQQEGNFSAFTQRLSKLFLGFLDSTRSMRSAHKNDRTLLEINLRFLMCALIVLRFCQGSRELLDDCLQAENTVQKYARVIIQQLLESGLSTIRSLYENLQRLSARERGIRSDANLAISWVVVIKVLSSAQIPRAGFWDLTSSMMATTNSLQTNDAQKFEELWKDMFTLLPLGEFDDVGVLSKGMRHTRPLQGWCLPQKLLKQVFDAYQRNQKQSPSFNDYCRALLTRCHYMIEQWGWYKCVGVVGTIFDFFGSRSLSHLRNEEVYRSPDFLEELSGSPCLSVQHGDRCFHIFLKVLALAIQHMKRQDTPSNVRNLITRCLPNHNRQYSREQTVHFEDLASLRNHHDLLCTLFWSAPPKDRRPVELIEKLVSPASSHKEACLINLRAWSQLARFVVSSGGSIEDYRPFMSWQNNIFQQLLTQYLTAANDVQQQFMSLAKEKRKDIQQHMLDAIVIANQNAAKDILYASVQASADVMKHCPSLASATFSFNVIQMNKVFDKLINANIDLDWGVLRACFDTIDLFVTRLEELWNKLKLATGDSISSYDNCAFEDAVEFLYDKVIRSFFAAVRRAMYSIPSRSDPRVATSAKTVEKAIVLCGRIASLFVEGGKSQVKHFFSPGSQHLFGGLPHELGLAERKFVPLFVATLLKNHVFSFSSIGYSHFDIWIQALVKPHQALRYENYLAETLKGLDISYMKGATVIQGAAPSYNANLNFFACGMSYMRKELRQADVAQRKPLRTKYEKLLKSVMQQMKTDIKSLELNSDIHQHYIAFVREIVGLIKSHGTDICTIDPFYFQVSAEYSPAKDDPQLHTASILAYGLRLGEDDYTAIPQLFYYLNNHFKSSLASGQIEAEVKVVANGMKDNNILGFVIGRMLPAIIQTSSRNPYIWPLLEVYSRAVRDVLGRTGVPREIPPKQTDEVVMLLEIIIDWFRRRSQSQSNSSLTAIDVHILTEIFKICNSIRPSLVCWLFLNHGHKIQDSLGIITALAHSTATHLSQATVSHEIYAADLLARWQRIAASRFSLQMDNHVVRFVQDLERELRTDWVVTPDRITVKAASNSSAQPSSGGIKMHLDGSMVGLLSSLLAQLKVWIDEIGQWGTEESGSGERRRLRRLADDTMPVCYLNWRRQWRIRRDMDEGIPIEHLLYGP